ncbi:FMN-linked oxidoreductase [Trametes meyenii]|nr:FMN-linked oxidoreductase [Trametes meyenii]
MAEFVTHPAPNVSYFTPEQNPPAGTAAPPKDGKALPTLFQPLKIRGVEFHNRLFVSPMAMSSADRDSTFTPFHTAILGAVIIRGPGLTFIEGAAISPEGRLTQPDVGLWSDEQIGPLREIIEFAHSQGQKVGIQLAHAGRKASVAPLWIAGHGLLTEEYGGWAHEIVAPSAISYVEAGGAAEAIARANGAPADGQGVVPDPTELSREGIHEIVKKWAAAAKRAVEAGVDVIEIHGAHGFLLHEFLSPVSNKRTDVYGGSFENRVRIVVEIVDAIRKVIPESTPLFYRTSATDWLEKVAPEEPSWRLEDTVRLAGLIAEHGVDLIDVSSGGLDPRQKFEFTAPAYQANFAEVVRKAHGDRILVGAVGGIKTGKQAQEVLDKNQADVIFAATQFLKDPGAVATFAEDLGVEVKLPHQFDWVFNGRGSAWRWARKL